MNDYLTNAIASGVAIALRDLGLSNGEMSYRKAKETYGAAFTQLENAGKLSPCRYGEKAKYFLVSDILRAISEEQMKVKERLYIV